VVIGFRRGGGWRGEKSRASTKKKTERGLCTWDDGSVELG